MFERLFYCIIICVVMETHICFTLSLLGLLQPIASMVLNELSC